MLNSYIYFKHNKMDVFSIIAIVALIIFGFNALYSAISAFLHAVKKVSKVKAWFLYHDGYAILIALATGILAIVCGIVSNAVN